MRLQKISIVFLVSLVLNFVWEYLHSYLYAFYQHGSITLPILVRAAVVDAIIITALYGLFSHVPLLKNTLWFAVLLAVGVAVVIELYAMATGRWQYNAFMPVIPVLGIGLSPLLQLPLLTYTSFKTADIIQVIYKKQYEI